MDRDQFPNGPQLQVQPLSAGAMDDFGKGLVYGAIGVVVLFFLIQRLR